MKTKTIICILFILISSFACGNEEQNEIAPPKENEKEDTTEKPEAQATIDLSPIGKTIEWGFDIKQHNVCKNVTIDFAKQLYNEDNMTMLRISILPLEHNEDGSVIANAQLYPEAMAAIKNVLTVNPDVKIFASLKLNGEGTFFEWTREPGKLAVRADKYTDIIKGFFNYMKSNDVKIHILGIDNEMEYNKANITPQKYIDIADALKTWFATQPELDFPLLIAPEDYGPRPDWVTGLLDKGRGDLMNIAGTHYYPKHRPYTKLKALADAAKDYPLWNSEVHWDKLSDNEIAAGKTSLDEFEKFLIATFDCFDLGATGMIWWGYNRTGNSAHLYSTTSTARYRMAKITDHDGNDLKSGAFNTRVFVNGNKVSLWVSNNSNVERKDYTIDLNGRKIKTDISYKQWDNNWVKKDNPFSKTFAGGKDYMTISFPAKTICLMQFEVE